MPALWQHFWGDGAIPHDYPANMCLTFQDLLRQDIVEVKNRYLQRMCRYLVELVLQISDA
jgi:hypothetical protein